MSAKSFDKIIEEIGNMSVLDLADLVKALEEKFGVSAAMPMAGVAAPAAAAGATPAQEEKSAYKVVIQSGGSEKIKLIKALRQVIPSVSLTDAKGIADQLEKGDPYVVSESSSKEDAAKIKEALEAAGAKVQLS